jgi:CubicO group peptidase (beta-lactamase class C family)
VGLGVYVADGAGIKQLESSQDKPSELDPDYPLSDAHVFLSGGGGLCSTASDYLRFCQMLLNGGDNNGVRLLKNDTIKLTRTDQTGPLGRNFGFGFTMFPETEDVHQQLRGAYAWFGHWSTSFRISPRGEWAIVTMSQLQWTDDTPKWFAQYERLAAEAVME